MINQAIVITPEGLDPDDNTKLHAEDMKVFSDLVDSWRDRGVTLAEITNSLTGSLSCSLFLGGFCETDIVLFLIASFKTAKEQVHIQMLSELTAESEAKA